MTSEFNAREFYEFGVKIAGVYIEEAGYRTAIGRVYYACHLIGADATHNKGWFSPKHNRDDHSGLWRKLIEHNQDDLAHKLRELCELREHADYHIRACAARACKFCDSVTEGSNLVDAQMWQRAEAIATTILPRLDSINPKKSCN